jgi:hypothetical protein
MILDGGLMILNLVLINSKFKIQKSWWLIFNLGIPLESNLN